MVVLLVIQKCLIILPIKQKEQELKALRPWYGKWSTQAFLIILSSMDYRFSNDIEFKNGVKSSEFY